MSRRALLCTLALTACSRVTPTTAPGPVVTVASLRRSIDSMVADPKFRTAQLGILVVDPERGDTLYSHNAGKLFMPASNQKLLTGAVALEQLGPDFRFSTSVFADGSVVDGVLQGNLRVVGTGDPSASDHMVRDAMLPMRAMAESLTTRGIRRVAGALVPGGDAFPDATLGFGWSWDDLDAPYSAGVDELFFNEGFMQFDVFGGAAVGDSVRVRMGPMRAFPRVRLLARTGPPRVASEPRRRLGVRHDTTDAGAIIIDGLVAAGDSIRGSLTYRDPSRAYLEALREALADAGVAVDGGVGPASPPADSLVRMEPRGTLLFSVSSPTLREILPFFEKPSQNQIGEILLKSLGRAKAGIGRADSGARVIRDQLLAWGARPDGFVVRDGSGLSRHNVITPETIVILLDAMRKSPNAALFRSSLPVAGVDGTIRNRMRNTPAQGNLQAKTGTLDMVRSLSGYITTADGRTLIFSMLANNFRVPVREVEIVQDAIGVQLARLRGTR